MFFNETEGIRWFIKQLLVFFIFRGTFEFFFRKTKLRDLKLILFIQAKTEKLSNKKIVKLLCWFVAVTITFPIAYLSNFNYIILGLTIATVMFLLDISFENRQAKYIYPSS